MALPPRCFAGSCRPYRRTLPQFLSAMRKRKTRRAGRNEKPQWQVFCSALSQQLGVQYEPAASSLSRKRLQNFPLRSECLLPAHTFNSDRRQSEVELFGVKLSP
jgi:hypothetical protein